MTVKLQGIYNKQEAKAVKELKTGDVIMWNYGWSYSKQDREDIYLSSEKQSRWRCS